MRLRRYWVDLWEGLADPYGSDPRLSGSVEDLVRVLAGRWAGRPADLRALDRRRALRPDWFQAPEMVGYVFYVDRFAGTLARRRGASRLPRGARGPLRPPDAPPSHASRRQRRRLRGGGLPGRRPGSRQHGGPGAPVRPALRERGISVCIDLVLNHCAAEHEWATRARAGDPEYSSSTSGSSRTARGPNRYEAHAAGGVPRLRPGQLHAAPRRALGLDDVQRLPVGPQLGEPAGLRRDHRHPARAREPRRRRLPARCRRLHVEAAGHELPEPARGPRPPARAAGVRPDRRPGGHLQGGGDRRARTIWRRTWASAGTTAASATSPTTTASWSSSGRPSPRATPG